MNYEKYFKFLNSRRIRFSKSRREYNNSRKIGTKSFFVDFKKMSDESIFLSTSDVEDLVTANFCFDKFKEDKNVKFLSMHLLCSINDWNEFITKCELNIIKFFCPGEDYGVIFFQDGMVKYNVSSTSITIKLVGEDNFIDELAQVIRKNFNLAESFIDWIYSSDGNSVTVPLTEEKSPVTEMYPFLGKESLKSYYDRYMHSSASVLVLLGPPGTGKTSFVRGLLQHTKTSAVVTYDPELLEKDYVFAKFIEGNNNVMVIEDADNFLGARRDGNTVMHKFLNVGDGLVTTRNKKLIFSTNLPSVKEIDSALVRPGRCFDTLLFTYLNKQQALKLANVMNLKLESDKTSYSIADIFHVQEHIIVERRMGFL
jgi:hypothetical protein